MKIAMNSPAHASFRPQKGFAPIILIIVAAVVGLVVIGFASGALKGSFKVTKNEPQKTQQETNSATQKETAKQSPATAKTNELSKTYTNTTLGFQVNYPESWKIAEDKASVTIYAPKADVTSQTKSDAAVIVSSSPLGTLKGLQLTTIADVMKNQMGNFLPGATVVNSHPTTVGGRQAHLFDLDYTQNGQKYPSAFYLLVDEKNLYGVITSVLESKKTTHEETLKAITNSFKIL